jgi:fatty-acyl-CoA synthase
VDALREGDYDLSSLFGISTQAVALTPGTRKALHELLPNVMIIESYGTTEGGFQGLRIGTAADPDIDLGGKFDRVNETVIVDETKTRILDPDEVEVVGWTARPGRLPRGYYKDPEKTRETFFDIDGVRYTVSGDRAYWRPDGSIQFLGREAVCINTGGEKVFGEEVESALKSHPSVADAIVLGTPDERFGERVTAVVTLRNEAADTDLQDHCRRSIAGYKVPRAFVRVEKVPRLENGKPDYRGAKDLALAALEG